MTLWLFNVFMDGVINLETENKWSKLVGCKT